MLINIVKNLLWIGETIGYAQTLGRYIKGRQTWIFKRKTWLKISKVVWSLRLSCTISLSKFLIKQDSFCLLSIIRVPEARAFPAQPPPLVLRDRKEWNHPVSCTVSAPHGPRLAAAVPASERKQLRAHMHTHRHTETSTQRGLRGILFCLRSVNNIVIST